MHRPEIREEALRLVAAGVNDCEIARRLGSPARPCATGAGRATSPAGSRARAAAAGSARRRSPEPTTPSCSACIWATATSARLARTQSLRIFLDARYPAIVDDTEALLRRCFPDNRVGRVALPRRRGWLCSGPTAAHLACLFPQHGPGKKHERRILLEDWQRSIVEAAPWAFLRGCIRSDGCVFVNRTGRYEYLSYGFANYSADILDLFESTCRRQGLRPRRYAARSGSTGAGTSHAWSSTSASSPEPANRYGLSRLRLWRNWQTRGVQVAVSLRSWRFESSQPHRRMGQRGVSPRRLSRPSPPMTSMPRMATSR